MSLARKMARKRAKSKKAAPVADGNTIKLENPVSEHFGSFIYGNADVWQLASLVEAEKVIPPEDFGALVQEYQKYGARAYASSKLFREAILPYAPNHFVQEHSATGQHLVLCGAGPSLTEHADEWCPKGDQVWGCNSAVTWLAEHGHKPTHGFACDQTPHMVLEWRNAPDVEYLLASSVHPHLTEHLLSKGRKLRWFHNFLGMKRRPVSWEDDEGVQRTETYEDWLYMMLYAGTVRAGSGLNAVTRAIDVARYMGFAKITVLGADCALRIKSRPPEGALMGSPERVKWLHEETTMHADGGSALASDASPMTLGAEIDAGTPDETIRPGHGRYWETKIDLLLSAIWLKTMAVAFKGQVELVGDTLPAAFMGKSDEYLSRIVSVTGENNKPVEIKVG